MELGEKLQELRKSRGLTQEELAEALYVSRTAVSKWESGRGYPSIDSLKVISSYFGVTVDELLSAEKILTIAEKENKANVRGICDLLFGIVDIFSLILIFLPLYPNKVNGYIYSVNLFRYTDVALWVRAVFWVIFSLMISAGIVKIILNKIRSEKSNKIITVISMLLSCLAVLFLALTREVYAVAVVFMMLMVKALLLFRYNNLPLHKEN